MKRGAEEDLHSLPDISQPPKKRVISKDDANNLFTDGLFHSSSQVEYARQYASSQP